MHDFLRLTKAIITRYAQVLFVLLAFTLMVLSSYYFIRDTEIKHLRRNAADAISNTELNIKSDLLEPETLLGGISETIRLMIINKESIETINSYLKYINNYVESGSGEGLLGVTGLFGFFDVFGGIFLLGLDWDPGSDYDPVSRPWYTGAVDAAGRISITEPYINTYSSELTMTMSRRIFDNDGNSLGIICLNIELTRIKQYAVNTRFTKDGYGFLMSNNLEVIAHPEPSIIGIPLAKVKSGVSVFDSTLRQGNNVSEEIVHDYRGIESIVFIQRLYNGWYMGVVTPKDNYFSSSVNLALILSVLGILFASLLIWILMRIFREKAKSDERMQLIFDSTPYGASFWDRNFNIIDCNKNAVDMLGLSSKKEYLEKFFSLCPEFQPDGKLSREKGFELIQKALKAGYCRFEWIHQKLDGEPIPCEITLVRVYYRNGYSVIGYTRDLREQKQMLKEIQQRTRLLNTVNVAAAILLDNEDMSVFEASLLKCFDLIGHCLDVDRVQIWRNEMQEDELHFVLRYEWLSAYGKECKPVPYGLHFPYSIKTNWLELFSRGEFINAPLSMLPEEDRVFLESYEMKSIVIIPMFLEGNFWGFFCIEDCRIERTFSEDEINILTSAGLMMISALNRNIQTIKMYETEERTRIMMDAAPLCMIFWDGNLNLVDCNNEAVKMFGFSDKEEFLKKFLSLSPEFQPDGVSSIEKGVRLVRKALEDGYSRFEWMHQKQDGEQIPVEVTCIRVKYRDELTVIEYIRDLREQKAMIAEMRKAEIAEESSKAKSDFLAKMSHEIRTPMNAILGIAEIQLQNETYSGAIKEAFLRIYNSGDLLLGIINDILDLSKIEAGKFILVPAQYDIASLIYDTVQLNMIRFESKPVEFFLNVSENLPLLLVGDELRIKQILNNLLSNAFKYTEEGSVNLSVYTEPYNTEEDLKITLVFVVNDTGQGMTAEQIEILGTEYSRFNMESNRKTEGAGLGMNITYNLIKMMEGSISIESTPGMGSTFTVTLPQECVGTSILGKELADNLMQLNFDTSMKIRNIQMKREYMPYGSVLVVDDVESNLYVAKGLMSPYGLKIDTVTSGFEAINKIKEGSFYDIIFMDHMMPRMDGIEATRIIRNSGYTKPIVVLTANIIAGQAEKFMENGFDDFISKPIDMRQLNMVLNKLIRDKYPHDVVEAARQQQNIKFADVQNDKPVDSQLGKFFLNDAKKAITTLEALFSKKFRRSDDISVFIINVHAMKSSLANIGETELSGEAAKLEQAGREQNTGLILSELPVFLEQLYAVVEKFESKEETRDMVNDKTMEDNNNSFLKEKLSAVKSACEQYDKKTAKNILAELRQKTWPHSVEEQFNTLSSLFLHSDFEEAAKIINDYLTQSENS
ncbi:MAG: response regulator [Treponema sp.]|jgi:PAS domain S-box-containing protein|nr:response regulator [Treponema sp.]